MNKEELKRKNSENEFQFIYRLCKYKDSNLLDVTWDELGVMLNDELNYEYTSSKYRKFYQYAKICDEHVFTYRNPDEQIKDLQDLNWELKKQAVKTRDERTALNRKIREEARKESYIDLVQREFSKFEPIEFKDIRQSPTHTSDNDLIVHLTDIHAGILIDNFWNQYNSDEMQKRFERYLNKIIEIQAKHQSENCYIIIGEIVSGLIHENLRIENNQHVIDQFMSVVKCISAFLIELSKIFKNVNVYITPGNHSRCVANKNSSLKGENFDNLIPFTLNALLQNHKNICIYENTKDESVAVFEVRGNIIMSSHGDKDKPEKVVQNFSQMFRMFPDIIYLGHRHTNGYRTIFDVKVIESGCVSGSDNYAIDHRLKNKPEQTVSVITNDGLDCIYDIQLD